MTDNEAYAGGGLQGAFGAVSGIFGSGIKNGAGATIQGIGEIASGLSGSGGMGKLVGAAVSGIGTIGKAVAGLVGKVGGLIAAHPEVFAIIALVAGIAGLGLFLWKKYGRKGGSADDGSASDETPALQTSKAFPAPRTAPVPVQRSSSQPATPAA